MRRLIIFIFTIYFLPSCKSGNSHNTSAGKPLDYESALKQTQQHILASDSLFFIFPINKIVTDKPVYKSVYNKTEIEKFGSLFIQDAQRDSCKPLNYEASMLVYRQDKYIDTINISLNTDCPAFQFRIDNTIFTSKMSYLCGVYLDNIVQTENQKMFEEK